VGQWDVDRKEGPCVYEVSIIGRKSAPNGRLIAFLFFFFFFFFVVVVVTLDRWRLEKETIFLLSP